MNSESGRTEEMKGEDRVPKPMSPACDKCTLGVMDYENPHLWGECECDCHIENRRYGPGNPDWERDLERERNGGNRW